MQAALLKHLSGRQEEEEGEMEVRVMQPIKGWCETQRGQRVATPGMLSPLCSVHTPFLIQQGQVMTLSRGVFPWQGKRTGLKT